MLISVGWVPPYWCPSRRVLRSRGRGWWPHNALEGYADTGAAPLSLARACDHFIRGLRLPRWPGRSGGQRDEAGDGPGEGRHLAGDGHYDLVDVFPPGR